MMQDQHLTSDDSLPTPYRMVRSVVLRTNTPLEALISAAGYHQSCQQDTVVPSFSDVLLMFHRQYQHKLQHPDNHGHQPALTDEDVFGCLTSVGIAKGDEALQREAEDLDMTQDEALQHASRARYNAIQAWRSSARFACANTDRIESLTKKIDFLNVVREKDIPPFRSQVFREHTGLLADDYRELATWVMGKTKLPAKELAAQMETLRRQRTCRWHIYGAPAPYVTDANRTEEMVRYLMKEVTIPCLTSPKWGGSFWAKIKNGQVDTPGWDRLKLTEFWQNPDRFRAVHRILNGSADVAKAETEATIAVERGSVKQSMLDIGHEDSITGRRQKQFMLGKPLPVLAVALAQAVIIELDIMEEWVSPWLMKVLEYDVNTPLIIMGPREAVKMVELTIHQDDRRQTQTIRRVIMYTDEEGPFGLRDDRCQCKDVHILLVTPHEHIGTYRPYIILRNLPSTPPQVYLYLLSIIGLPEAHHCRNVVWIPNTTRSVETIQQIIAEAQVHLPSWSFLLGHIQPLGDTTTFLASLTRCLTAAHADMRSPNVEAKYTEHVLKLIRQGDILSPESIKRDRYKDEASMQPPPVDADTAEHAPKKDKKEKTKSKDKAPPTEPAPPSDSQRSTSRDRESEAPKAESSSAHSRLKDTVPKRRPQGLSRPSSAAETSSTHSEPRKTRSVKRRAEQVEKSPERETPDKGGKRKRVVKKKESLPDPADDEGFDITDLPGL